MMDLEDWDIETFEECSYFQMYGEHDWNEPVKLGEVQGVELWMRKCKVCGEMEQEVLFEEFWENEYVYVLDKKYRAKKSWGNICTCSECGKVIFDVPLILWRTDHPYMAVTFHVECARKIGLLDLAGVKE